MLRLKPLFYCAFLLSLLCLFLAHTEAQEIDAPPKGAPLVFDGKTLLTLYANIGPYQPAERAQIISERLQSLARDSEFRPDAIAVVDTDSGFDVRAGNLSLVTVTPGDAQAVGRPGRMLATEYADILRKALTAYRHEHSLRSIFEGVVVSLLATLLWLLAFKLLGIAYRVVARRLESWRLVHTGTLHPQARQLLSMGRVTEGILALLGVVRLTLALLLTAIYLTVVFGQFPWTRGLAQTLFQATAVQLTLAWNGFVAHLPDILFIGIIWLITTYALKVIRFLFTEVARGTITVSGLDQELIEPTYKIVRFLVLALAVVAAFPYIPGSRSPAFQGISVFLGLLLSLGSSSAMSNIIAGVVLTYMRPFRIGDRVKIADTMGDVVEKSLLVTRIRTIKNEDITIPNAMALGAHIVNYSEQAHNAGLILHTAVTIGYDAPWRQVHQLLLDAARATEALLEDPAPFVLQTALNDFYVTYELNAYTRQPNRMIVIYSELHQNIQDKFNEAGVEIMSPHYASLRDGNPIAIPTDYVPSDYQPPAFRVSTPKRAGQKNQEETTR